MLGVWGGCCDHFLGKTVPLWDGRRKESHPSVCCPVGWNVVGEGVRVPGGFPGVLGF